MFPFSSPFSFQLLWTLTRTTKNRKTTASKDHEMDTLMLIALSVAVMKKYNSSFVSRIGEFQPKYLALLIRSKFGYNSEKQFNNSLFLKTFEPREMAAVNNYKAFDKSPVERCQNRLLATPPFLD